MGLAGKTIECVEELPFGEQRLWFTDGTCADFEPEGYETEGVSVIERSAEDLKAARVKAEQDAIDRANEAARRARAREAYRAEMERQLPPARYKAWLTERDTLGPFLKAMKDTFEGAVKDQIKSTNCLFYGASS